MSSPVEEPVLPTFWKDTIQIRMRRVGVGQVFEVKVWLCTTPQIQSLFGMAYLKGATLVFGEGIYSFLIGIQKLGEYYRGNDQSDGLVGENPLEIDLTGVGNSW